MTKEDVFSVIIYLIMAAIILIVGFAVIRPAMEGGYLAVSAGSNFLFLLLSLVIAVLINAMFLEFGHLLGAKIGGYEVLSFNLLGLCFYKKEVEGKRKLAFKIKGFDGITGETVITPKKDKANPMFYVFIPLILMLLEFIALYCVLTFIKTDKDATSIERYLKYGVIVLSAIGGCFIVYNYFPARIDSLNDGYRLVLLNKKVNIEAYNLKLKLEEDDFFNKEEVELKTFDDITDFTATINLETAVKTYEKGNVDKALEIIDFTLKDPKKMSRVTREDILMTKAYIYFLEKPLEEAKEFYNNTFNQDEKNVIRSCKKYTQINTYTLYVGLVENSRSEIEFAITKKRKLDKSESEGEVNKENKRFEKVLDKIYKEFPELEVKEKASN